MADDLQKLNFDSKDDDGNVDFSKKPCKFFLWLIDFSVLFIFFFASETKSARKALIYGICLMALNQFCGCFAMMTATATIFKESGSNLSPNISSIIVGGIQIIGSMFPTLLVDRLGRKMMMGLSAFGTSMGLGILGGYTFLKSESFNLESFTWIPLVAFSFVIFIANWGVMTLPFMIVSEISHPKVILIYDRVTINKSNLYSQLLDKRICDNSMHVIAVDFCFYCFEGEPHFKIIHG